MLLFTDMNNGKAKLNINEAITRCLFLQSTIPQSLLQEFKSIETSIRRNPEMTEEDLNAIPVMREVSEDEFRYICAKDAKNVVVVDVSGRW